MINLEEYIIDEDCIEKINDSDVLMEYIKEGRPLQQLFGFSNETTVEFYEAAKSILEQNRYEDAINAFTFLTTLNPYISDFWLGLGMAHQQNNDFDKAIYAYSVGFKLKGGKIFPYSLAAQCCMEIKDYEQALKIMEQAEIYAEEHAEEEDTRKLKKDAKKGRRYILQEQKKG